MLVKAVIVIDAQNAVFELPVPLYKAEIFIENAEKIIRAARANSIPVIYMQHSRPNTIFEKGTPTWDFHPRLKPGRHDIVIAKTEPDSFTRTELESILEKHHAKELFICGLVTENCIDSTVRGAYTRGYKVNLFEDAHTSTGNPYMDAPMVIKYHNWLMQRFAKLVQTKDAEKLLASPSGLRQAELGDPA